MRRFKDVLLLPFAGTVVQGLWFLGPELPGSSVTTITITEAPCASIGFLGPELLDRITTTTVTVTETYLQTSCFPSGSTSIFPASVYPVSAFPTSVLNNVSVTETLTQTAVDEMTTTVTEYTSTMTLLKTVTNILSVLSVGPTLISPSPGPYFYSVADETTIWLGKTPAPTGSFVTVVSTATVIPLSTAPAHVSGTGITLESTGIGGTVSSQVPTSTSTVTVDFTSTVYVTFITTKTSTLTEIGSSTVPQISAGLTTSFKGISIATPPYSNSTTGKTFSAYGNEGATVGHISGLSTGLSAPTLTSVSTCNSSLVGTSSPTVNQTLPTSATPVSITSAQLASAETSEPAFGTTSVQPVGTTSTQLLGTSANRNGTVQKRSLGPVVTATIDGIEVTWINKYSPSANLASTASQHKESPTASLISGLSSAATYTFSLLSSVPSIRTLLSSTAGRTVSTFTVLHPNASSTYSATGSDKKHATYLRHHQTITAKQTNTKVSASASQKTASSTVASAPICSGISVGNFMIDFDDLPTLSAAPNSTNYVPMWNPYQKLWWSEGFSYVPRPSDPYLPMSPPHLGTFIVDKDANVHSQNYTGKVSSDMDVNGMFGAGPRFANPAYWFNAHDAAIGCQPDGSGRLCEYVINGWVFDSATGQSVQNVTQSLTQLPCNGFSGCALTEFSFDDAFRNLVALQIIATKAGSVVPVTWYIDNINLTWSNNTCEAIKQRDSGE